MTAVKNQPGMEPGIRESTRGHAPFVRTADPLPVPRLEVVWSRADEPPAEDAQVGGRDCWVAEYRLVLRHLLGHTTHVVLGTTHRDGRNGRVPDDLPFRDGCHAKHDAWHLHLPLYLVTSTGARHVDGPGGDDDDTRHAAGAEVSE